MEDDRAPHGPAAVLGEVSTGDLSRALDYLQTDPAIDGTNFPELAIDNLPWQQIVGRHFKLPISCQETSVSWFGKVDLNFFLDRLLLPIYSRPLNT